MNRDGTLFFPGWMRLMFTCVLGRKTKLKLNGDETEALLTKSDRTSLRVGTTDVHFTTCARNLGLMISDYMTLEKHISIVCRSACIKIRRISSARQYMTVESTRTLVCAFVLPRLDYCISLLSCCPLYLLSRLLKVQNLSLIHI